MNTDANEAFTSKFLDFAKNNKLRPFQEKVINHVIANGSTIAIMPTGGGKSLIYWVASQALGGTCLVISPLIALIDEQSEKLSNEGFNVLTIHGGMRASEQLDELKRFATGQNNPDYIFASPERLATDGFFEYCISLRKDRIKMLVIDEIHCVSQWGFSFRPFYKHIPDFLNKVFPDRWPIILGLTATINPKELQDICNDFMIPDSSIIQDEILLRFDIDLHIEKYTNEEEKEERLWNIFTEHKDEKVIVYLYRKYYKRGVEDLALKANDNGIEAVSFHGDMSGRERQVVIEKFRTGKIRNVFATNAFGMGIDISDIRVVVHFMLPESIEQYYQEIGRVGRDGNGATAYIFYTNKNIQVKKTHFIDKSFPKTDELNDLFTRATNNEVGLKTLQYFTEENLQNALPFFLNCGAMSIEGKGFTRMDVFRKNDDPKLQKILKSSRTGMVIPIMSKPDYAKLDCTEFFKIAYDAIIKDKAVLNKKLDKCLIIEAKENELSQEQIENIEIETNKKREYKHNLLDYLVYILDNFEFSKDLHQEIGRYLGVDKHQLYKIHKTESGIWVRSKSEVIIANILYRSNIPFIYEEKLYYSKGKWKEPDFTIHYNSKTWYWEHLGMLGDEEYNSKWIEKKKIYAEMGLMDNVIITKESAVLSNIVNEKIKLIKGK